MRGDWYIVGTFLMLTLVLVLRLYSLFGCNSGIRVTEWNAPNGLDRCYVATDGKEHWSMECVEVKDGQSGTTK